MKEIHEGNTHVMIDSDNEQFEYAVMGFVYLYLGAKNRDEVNEVLDTLLSLSSKLKNKR